MTIYKSTPFYGQVIPDLNLVATETLPEFNSGSENWETECRERFKQQGEEIYQQLLASLPGGTLDALLYTMIKHRASLLHVRYEEVTQ